MNSKDVIGAFEKVELTEAELTEVVGGVSEVAEVSERASAGWVCTISGECNSSGKSCNPFPWG